MSALGVSAFTVRSFVLCTHRHPHSNSPPPFFIYVAASLQQSWISTTLFVPMHYGLLRKTSQRKKGGQLIFMENESLTGVKSQSQWTEIKKRALLRWTSISSKLSVSSLTADSYVLRLSLTVDGDIFCSSQKAI